ncbi:helix-turn-helix domain-containing protein, partial [Porphyromonas sp. COT-290 OH860]|uniref:helix-turn-helix domain-containing protein n=1 Tax=Porphyromonas sp. COT-290 OH860 TaxID=1515615 RepID=UPI0005C5AB51
HVDTVNYILKIVIIRDIHNVSSRKEAKYRATVSFISPRTLQDYRDKGIIPYTQIAGKILYKLSNLEKLLKENYKP